MNRHHRNRLLGILMTLALVAGACGGGAVDQAGTRTTTENHAGDEGNATTAGSESTTTSDRVRRTTESETTTTVAEAPDEANGPSRPCTIPAPLEIGIGAPVQGEITGNGSEACYWIEIPDGLKSIEFEMSGLSANIQLTIAYGYVWNVQFPGSGRYWNVRPGDEPSGSTVIENPDPGPYFLQVAPNRPRAASTFDLVVTSTPETTTEPTGAALAGTDACEPPATEVALSTEVAGEFTHGSSQVADRPRQFFCVIVPEGTASLTVDLTTTGSVAVAAWHPSTFDSPATDSSFDGVVTLVVPEPVPGPNYVVLTNQTLGAGTGFAFTAEAG